MSDQRTKTTFSVRARRLKEHLGLSQNEMAKRFGVSRSYWSELVSPSKPRSPSPALEQMLGLMERLYELEGVASGDKSSIQATEEVSAGFPASRTGKPHSRRVTGGLSPEMILNKAYTPDASQLGETAYRIIEQLRPWLAAAEHDPEIANYLLSQLRTELPLSKLTKLEEKE